LPDSDNPWVVLVPEVADLVEWHDLAEQEQRQLAKEIGIVSRWLKLEFQAFKINVGSLGNKVPQLHIHVIARYENDKAWPGPIWGSSPGKDLNKIEALQKRLTELVDLF
jgi:diadenosine tetraphosphate (Ap4A) HIT family hydrolase